MIGALKSEFRKLLTVRSSYIIPMAAYTLLVFIQAYVMGYHNGVANTQGPGASVFLANSITQTGNILAIFGAIVALLMVTHEYRYGTIAYTLTEVNRRSKVLIAKLAAVAVYTVVFVLCGTAIALGSLLVGLHFSGAALPHQDISLVNYTLQVLCFSEAWALASMLLAVILRNQVASIAVLFIVPNTVEGLLSLLLKENTKYLPFTALSHVIAAPGIAAGPVSQRINELGTWTPPQAALLFGAYLAGGWIAGWILFLRRDAN